jgi:hypothetical protein
MFSLFLCKYICNVGRRLSADIRISVGVYRINASFQVICHPRLAITLETCIQEVLASNLGRDTVYLIEVFGGFPDSVQTNPGIVHKLSHDRFLPNPF